MNAFINVPAKVESLRTILELATNAGKQAELSPEKLYALRLAVEEIATNIIQHGYLRHQMTGELEVHTKRELNMLVITLIDSAPPFDITSLEQPSSLSLSAEEREPGGLGIYLALRSVDKYRYEQREGYNYTRLEFECPIPTFNRPLSLTKSERMNKLATAFLGDMGRMVSYISRLEPEVKNLSLEGQRLFHRLKEVSTTTLQASPKIFEQLNQFQKLIDTSTLIYSTLDLGQVLSNVMDNVVSLAEAGEAYLILWETDARKFVVQSARNSEGRNLSPQEFKYNNAVLETVFEKGRPVADGGVLCLPLISRREIIGALYALKKQVDKEFDEDTVLLLSLFANQAAVGIENARLFEQTRHDTMLERDVQIAQQIQAGFLPTEFPKIQGWEIAAYFNAARVVAGDFYDVFPLSHDRVGFVVGDVCDKGLGAALFMALFRSLLRAFAQQHHSLRWMDDILDDTVPKQVERRRTHLSVGATAMKNAIVLTNNYIAINHSDANMFATMFFGVIDPGRGALTYINGGHNPPVIVDAQGKIKTTLSVTGPAIGMMPDMEFDIQQVNLEPGDFLVCFTDGLVEAKSSEGDFFGDERLFNLLSQPDDSASSVVNRIKAAVNLYASDAPQSDDITMLVVRRE